MTTTITILPRLILSSAIFFAGPALAAKEDAAKPRTQSTASSKSKRSKTAKKNKKAHKDLGLLGALSGLKGSALLGRKGADTRTGSETKSKLDGLLDGLSVESTDKKGLEAKSQGAGSSVEIGTLKTKKAAHLPSNTGKAERHSATKVVESGGTKLAGPALRFSAKKQFESVVSHMKFCVQNGMSESDDRSSVRLSLQVEVDAKGRVVDAQIGHDVPRESKAGACVRRVLGGLTFRADKPATSHPYPLTIVVR